MVAIRIDEGRLFHLETHSLKIHFDFIALALKK